jgi:outer membrane protein OmpA-like peptidoglycan-associated protein
MTVNLIDLAKGLFTGDIISKASIQLNESEGSIRKAVETLVPALLAGLFFKGQSSGGAGLGSLLGGAKELPGGNDPAAMLNNALSNVGSTPAQHDSWRSKGYAWLQSILGDKTDAVTDMVAGYSGIQPSSASTLMGAAAPAVLSLTASQAGPGDSGIWSYLMTQKHHILNQLPSGLNLAGMPGLGSTGAVAGGPVPGNTAAYNGSGRAKGGGWMWVLLLLLVALALWYFLGQKGCNKGVEGLPVGDTAMVAPMNDSVVSEAAGTRESMMVRLPNGTELNAYKGGIEDQLVTFLNTDYMALGADSLKNIWFDFDNLNFETGSAAITQQSQAQIDNLAAILKAFPKAKLKIGGYTDKTGNEQANIKLSGERAAAVKKALDAAGVGSQIDGAEGYGSKFAKYASEAPETDRVKDRHVSVSVRG